MMLKYRPPFGISGEANKTMIKLPHRTQNSGLSFWSPSCFRRKNTSPVDTAEQCSRYNQNNPKLTNLTVDSISFGSQEFKAEKKMDKALSKKLKLTLNMKKRQSIVKRDVNKRRLQIGKFFSLKTKQATIHAVHSPEQLRYQVNSWNEAIIDRSIEKITVQLKQLFKMRPLRKSQKNKLEQDNRQDGNLINKNCVDLTNFGSLGVIRQQKVGIPASKKVNRSKKLIQKDEGEWFPWNQNSRGKTRRETLNKDLLSSWYDQNFSITLD